MAGRVAHKSTETGNQTKAKDKGITASLITRPLDKAGKHICRKGVTYRRDNIRP
ncbi:hypothetical protein A2U01_0104210 [Trifolium medium]|uniref:Uncharacterized protein n=1 Tax=Trifolium medium TaxID=97028 RepID=A0A392V3U1_9FABA|nr:hypothetical protein [Trifolium medium]